ncbi:MAG: PAS domain-containing protein [Xanthomonadaceae bacterium]|nr:PAS domain-containing protein [Xanthomonadaceae bacterium]
MTTTNPNRMEQLRSDAEERLRTGTTPVSATYGLGTEALSSLYRLASDPDRSGDALKLLHELQTHQVELDLQYAQVAENEQALAGQLGHFQALYDHAPAAYLVLGRDGRILRSNRAASTLFGLDAGQFEGHMLSSLLSQESKPAIQAALENAGTGKPIEAVQGQALDGRRLCLYADIAPGKDAVLMLVCPEAASQAS